MTGTVLVLLGTVCFAAPTRPEAGAPSAASSAFRPPMPLPSAPVDGHRHAHRSGALLRFDARLGVYTVTGARDVYFFADGFIRRRDGAWEFSDRPAGPWAPGHVEWVPLRLRIALYR